MTLTALQVAVCAGQWPSGARVVEDRRRPVTGRVAQLARLWKSCGDVIGTARARIFRAVTSVAVRGHGRVVVVLMAIRADH